MEVTLQRGLPALNQTCGVEMVRKTHTLPARDGSVSQHISNTSAPGR